MDRAHSTEGWRRSEINHRYGPNVHILSDPYLATRLARLCSPETYQPEFNRIVQDLYRSLLRAVMNGEFPRRLERVATRMAKTTGRAVLEADFLNPTTRVVTVDIARGGIIPSATIFEMLCEVMNPKCVRQDHLFMQRTTDTDGAVTGAQMNGSKVGGPIDGRTILFPDPMGATGSSLCQAIDHYLNMQQGTPGPIITMNLIITPEFIRRVMEEFPAGVKIYALRLDRGLSHEEVLATIPGERWNEEVGLDDHQYIVPGGGGFGELMNNALV